MLQRLVTSMVQKECSGTPNRKNPVLTRNDAGTRWRGRGTGWWSSSSSARSGGRRSLRSRSSMLPTLAVTRARIKGDSVSALVHERGGGDVVIAVHGLLSDGQAMLERLGSLGGKFRVIAPDLPGFGGSDKPRGFLYSPDGYAAFVVRLARALGIARFAVVGAGTGRVV